MKKVEFGESCPRNMNTIVALHNLENLFWKSVNQVWTITYQVMSWLLLVTSLTRWQSTGIATSHDMYRAGSTARTE